MTFKKIITYSFFFLISMYCFVNSLSAQKKIPKSNLRKAFNASPEYIKISKDTLRLFFNEVVPKVGYLIMNFDKKEKKRRPFICTQYKEMVWETILPSGLTKPLNGTIQINGGDACQIVNSRIARNLDLEEDCKVFLDECTEVYEDFIVENVDLSGCAKWEGSCSPYSNIHREGKVAIGTDQVPSGFRLAVKGGVITEKVGVIICDNPAYSWCDYVFEEEYNLMPLDEVECFIAENKHLPNIPSGKTIEDEGGFELRSMELKHQEKIEEAMLHLIDIHQQIASIKKEIQLVEKENQLLRNK